MKPLIIAEAGVNHNGSLTLAKKLVDSAVWAGADYIKFQTFKSSSTVSSSAKKAKYQYQNNEDNETQQEMLQKLELSFEEFAELSDYCKLSGIGFLSTAFDFESIDLLEQLDVPIWKIPSGEITNLPYLRKIAKLNKPIILSTGMSTMEDIGNALEVIQNHSDSDVTVLHCTSAYPTPFEDVNLLAMNTIGKTFDIKVGYSDHTKGIVIPISATSLGASVIEKHFTLDNSMEGPDHKASLEPEELKNMVDAIGKVSKSLGDGIKKVTASEKDNAELVRKSIVAKNNIQKGEVFSENNLTTKRPGTGISPMQWNDLLGRSATKDYKKDELIIF